MNGSDDSDEEKGSGETDRKEFSAEAARNDLADAFGKDRDPLAQFEETLEAMELVPRDTFKIYMREVIEPRDNVQSTNRHYRIAYDQWCQFMQAEGRHPACPTEEHVEKFASKELDEKDNDPDVVDEKLRKLDVAYQFWQDSLEFPHSDDYNPIHLARQKLNLNSSTPMTPPDLPLEELRKKLQSIENIRDLAVVLLMLKLGLRASELSNTTFSEVDIQHESLKSHYDDLGTNPVLDDRPNAIYIPHDKDGNKSGVPRVLPLDEETVQVLMRWLLIRPDSTSSNLFIGKTHHDKLSTKSINNTWKNVFQPEYNESDGFRAITSHYGRHWFTSFWIIEEDVNPELVRYMRGDSTKNWFGDGKQSAIDEYIHTYYEDIEPLYRHRIPNFRV